MKFAMIIALALGTTSAYADTGASDNKFQTMTSVYKPGHPYDTCHKPLPKKPYKHK